MATVTSTITRIYENEYIVSWTPLTTTNTDGLAFEPRDFADVSVAFTGTFGAGGTIAWQGSNDNSNWFTLNDAQAVALSRTSAALKQVAEVARYMRPLVSGGDGSTSLTATLYARRAR